MDKKLFDFYYEILSHYFHFPEISDTSKSIGDGLNLLRDYPQDNWDFQSKRHDIIEYIVTARKDNIIYHCQEGQKALPPIVPGVPYRSLYQADRHELCVQLEKEIFALTLKGLHQVIKYYHPMLEANSLSEELLRLDASTLQKYGLQ